jgi:uracil-DNA glycosylase
MPGRFVQYRNSYSGVRMDPNSRTRIENWLTYAEELGLTPFYRDRAIQAQSNPPAATVIEPAAEIPEPMPKPAQSRPPIPTAATPISTPNKTAASFFPAATGPTLFEAADRIPGDTLEIIRADLGECTRCKLHKTRNKIVFGDGSEKADLVFVGEGPGHDEDVQGLPFVGRAGKLLTQMIEAMGLQRKDVYICNVVKCRPPENRMPERDEIAACSPFLIRQIDAIHPKVIVCLGATAAQMLLNTNRSISAFRGEWLEYRGTRLLATYHPAYLLRNPAAKSEVWKDLQKVMAVLGLKAKSASAAASQR